MEKLVIKGKFILFPLAIHFKPYTFIQENKRLMK